MRCVMWCEATAGAGAGRSGHRAHSAHSGAQRHRNYMHALARGGGRGNFVVAEGNQAAAPLPERRRSDAGVARGFRARRSHSLLTRSVLRSAPRRRDLQFLQSPHTHALHCVATARSSRCTVCSFAVRAGSRTRTPHPPATRRSPASDHRAPPRVLRGTQQRSIAGPAPRPKQRVASRPSRTRDPDPTPRDKRQFWQHHDFQTATRRRVVAGGAAMAAARGRRGQCRLRPTCGGARTPSTAITM